MAKKNYYALKSSTLCNIFDNWDDCKSAMKGLKQISYKGFSSLQEAEAFIRGISSAEEEYPKPGRLIAYVDGSYEESLKRYSFGCILLTASGELIKKSGSGDNPESLAIRNVAGEMLGAMYAVRYAAFHAYEALEIRYDYEGIEKWVSGVWKTKNNLTSKYSEYMKNMGSKLNIAFRKVAAHSNNKYNDMADQLAKEALKKQPGIPAVD